VVAWLHERHPVVVNQRSEALKRESWRDFQGTGGVDRGQRGQGAGRIVGAIQGPCHSDHQLEAAVAGASRGSLWRDDDSLSDAGPQALHAKLGQLALENDFVERALIKAGLLTGRLTRSMIPIRLHSRPSHSQQSARCHL
jgi:hypothetical protein